MNTFELASEVSKVLEQEIDLMARYNAAKLVVAAIEQQIASEMLVNAVRGVNKSGTH
jgi:hypothetical protein